MKLSKIFLSLALANGSSAATRDGLLSVGRNKAKSLDDARRSCRDENKVLAAPNSLEELKLMFFKLKSMPSYAFEHTFWADIALSASGRWEMENGEEAPLQGSWKEGFSEGHKCVVFSLFKRTRDDFLGGASWCSVRHSYQHQIFFCRALTEAAVSFKEQTEKLLEDSPIELWIKNYMPFEETIHVAFANAKGNVPKRQEYINAVVKPINNIGLRMLNKYTHLYCEVPKKTGGENKVFENLSAFTDRPCEELKARVENMILFNNNYFAKCKTHDSFVVRRNNISSSLNKKLQETRKRLNKCDRKMNRNKTQF